MSEEQLPKRPWEELAAYLATTPTKGDCPFCKIECHRDLRRHLMDRHFEGGILCYDTSCTKAFSQMNNYRVHMKTQKHAGTNFPRLYRTRDGRVLPVPKGRCSRTSKDVKDVFEVKRHKANQQKTMQAGSKGSKGGKRIVMPAETPVDPQVKQTMQELAAMLSFTRPLSDSDFCPAGLDDSLAFGILPPSPSTPSSSSISSMSNTDYNVDAFSPHQPFLAGQLEPEFVPGSSGSSSDCSLSSDSFVGFHVAPYAGAPSPSTYLEPHPQHQLAQMTAQKESEEEYWLDFDFSDADKQLAYLIPSSSSFDGTGAVDLNALTRTSPYEQCYGAQTYADFGALSDGSSPSSSGSSATPSPAPSATSSEWDEIFSQFFSS